MLILAGVSINLVLGPNGLITKAQEAALKTDEAQEKELIEMAITSSKMENVNTLEISKTSLEKALREQFGNNKDFTVTDNGDGSFLINMNDTQRNYYVESTGDIIDDSNMIEIGTAEELKAFRDDVNSGNTYEGKYVYLTNDITLDINEEWEPIGLYPMSNSSPEDETNTPFSGIFDGKNYQIEGIYINTTDKVQGLFGLISDGTIKNLSIRSEKEIIGGVSTGAIAGYIINNSIISNCKNEVSITGNGYVGGICGQARKNSEIKECNNIATINSTDKRVGGIVGRNALSSKIISCENTGNVIYYGENEAQLGGIVR